MNALGTGGIAKTLMVDLAIRYGFQVFGAFVILAVGFVIARWLGGLAGRGMGRGGGRGASRSGCQVFGAFVILAVGFVIARWLGGLAERRMARAGVDVPIRTLGVRVLKLVVLLFALIVALDKFGFQIAPLDAGIGL